jgi:Uma2 family endonuclease
MSSTIRWTSADLELFPDDGKRREIIDGELYVSRQPAWGHQDFIVQLGGDLNLWNRRTRLGRVATAPGLIFAEDEDVAPDLVWISRERLARYMRGGKLYGPPELVVEILSPGPQNARRDREAKLKLYGRQGVDEYWIVDLLARTIAIYRLGTVGLDLAATLGLGDTLMSPLLPGFAAPLADLFADIPQE